ncbi:unnamed protein product, partial [Rotaria sp. Silwood1]
GDKYESASELSSTNTNGKTLALMIITNAKVLLVLELINAYVIALIWYYL